MRAQVALLSPKLDTRSQNLKTRAPSVLQVFRSSHISITFLVYMKTKCLQLSIIYCLYKSYGKKEKKKVSKLILMPVTNTAF